MFLFSKTLEIAQKILQNLIERCRSFLLHNFDSRLLPKQMLTERQLKWQDKVLKSGGGQYELVKDGSKYPELWEAKEYVSKAFNEDFNLFIKQDSAPNGMCLKNSRTVIVTTGYLEGESKASTEGLKALLAHEVKHFHNNNIITLPADLLINRFRNHGYNESHRPWRHATGWLGIGTAAVYASNKNPELMLDIAKSAISLAQRHEDDIYTGSAFMAASILLKYCYRHIVEYQSDIASLKVTDLKGALESFEKRPKDKKVDLGCFTHPPDAARKWVLKLADKLTNNYDAGTNLKR